MKLMIAVMLAAALATFAACFSGAAAITHFLKEHPAHKSAPIHRKIPDWRTVEVRLFFCAMFITAVNLTLKL